MADKPENKGGSSKSQDKSSLQSQRPEFRDGSGGRKPIVEQKVTSNLKPPTRPKNK